MAHKVILRCLKQGCPRKKTILSEDLPRKVKEVHSYCPWHEKAGWKAYPELFFGNKGERIYLE